MDLDVLPTKYAMDESITFSNVSIKKYFLVSGYNMNSFLDQYCTKPLMMQLNFYGFENKKIAPGKDRYQGRCNFFKAKMG